MGALRAHQRNTVVNFTGEAEQIGQVVPVRITAANPNSLRGESVSGRVIVKRRASAGSPEVVMQIEMTVKTLMIDPATNLPIVILRDKDGSRVLPIWVGVAEANAIAFQIENVTTPRPMTHDLLRNVICDLEGRIERWSSPT